MIKFSAEEPEEATIERVPLTREFIGGNWLGKYVSKLITSSSNDLMPMRSEGTISPSKVRDLARYYANSIWRGWLTGMSLTISSFLLSQLSPILTGAFLTTTICLAFFTLESHRVYSKIRKLEDWAVSKMKYNTDAQLEGGDLIEQEAFLNSVSAICLDVMNNTWMIGVIFRADLLEIPMALRNYLENPEGGFNYIQDSNLVRVLGHLTRFRET